MNLCTQCNGELAESILHTLPAAAIAHHYVHALEREQRLVKKCHERDALASALRTLVEACEDMRGADVDTATQLGRYIDRDCERARAALAKVGA